VEDFKERQGLDKILFCWGIHREPTSMTGGTGKCRFLKTLSVLTLLKHLSAFAFLILLNAVTSTGTPA
jgi:hypothetical protein